MVATVFRTWSEICAFAFTHLSFITLIEPPSTLPLYITGSTSNSLAFFFLDWFSVTFDPPGGVWAHLKPLFPVALLGSVLLCVLTSSMSGVCLDSACRCLCGSSHLCLAAVGPCLWVWFQFVELASERLSDDVWMFARTRAVSCKKPPSVHFLPVSFIYVTEVACVPEGLTGLGGSLLGP